MTFHHTDCLFTCTLVQIKCNTLKRFSVVVLLLVLSTSFTNVHLITIWFWVIFYTLHCSIILTPRSDRGATGPGVARASNTLEFFPQGGSDTRQVTFDLWPSHWHTHTWTQTPDLEAWQLWTSGLCLYRKKLSVVIFHACPALPFLVGQWRPIALNCLNLWPCGFLPVE